MNDAPLAAAAPPLRLHRFEMVLIAAVLVADQATKALVRAHIPLHDSVPVVAGCLNLTHVRNTGAAFGFLNAVDFPYKAAVVALAATAALIGIAFYAARVSSHERLARHRAGADSRRRRRQPDRPALRWAPSSTSSTWSSAAGTSGRSTSPTRPSRSA